MLNHWSQASQARWGLLYIDSEAWLVLLVPSLILVYSPSTHWHWIVMYSPSIHWHWIVMYRPSIHWHWITQQASPTDAFSCSKRCSQSHGVLCWPLCWAMHRHCGPCAWQQLPGALAANATEEHPFLWCYWGLSEWILWWYNVLGGNAISSQSFDNDKLILTYMLLWMNHSIVLTIWHTYIYIQKKLVPIKTKRQKIALPDLPIMPILTKGSDSIFDAASDATVAAHLIPCMLL